MRNKNFVDPKKLATLVAFEKYCEEHPGSPSAVRRPELIVRGSSCAAILGRNFQEGIVGLGSSVAAALRSFDTRYLNTLRGQG